MMYIDDAMLIDGAFRPDYLVQKLHLGNQNRQISAPNQLKWAIMTSPYTIFVILIRIFFLFYGSLLLDLYEFKCSRGAFESYGAFLVIIC